MEEKRDPESSRLESARDQIDRNELHAVLRTLWDEGRDAVIAADRDRLEAVVELALAVRERARGEVKTEAGELAESFDRWLAAPHALLARPIPAAAVIPRRGILFAALAATSGIFALVFAGSGSCDNDNDLYAALVFLFLVGLLTATGLALGLRRATDTRRARAVKIVGSVVAGVVATTAVGFLSVLAALAHCGFD